MNVRVMSPQISVRNLQRKAKIDVVDLEKFAEKAVRRCRSLPRNRQTDLMKLRAVSVLLISDRRMSSLHRQFLNQRGPTDVITFAHGEIFISAETAARHARLFGNSIANELKLYVVHGLLHLHGFDDRTTAEAAEMKKVQDRILGTLN